MQIYCRVLRSTGEGFTGIRFTVTAVALKSNICFYSLLYVLLVRLQFSRKDASCSYRMPVYLIEIRGSTIHSRMKECIRDGYCTRIQGSLRGWCLGEWLEYSDSAVQEWGALAKMRMKGGLAQDTPIPKLLSAWRLIFTWRLNVCPLHPWRLFQLPSGSCVLDSVTSFPSHCFLCKAQQLHWNEITLSWSCHSCFQRAIP